MRLPQLTDEQLLLRRSPGEAGDSFAEFYGRHERLIVAFHVRRVRDAELAADLTAETFAQALASRAKYRSTGEGSAVRWLYGIAAHVLARSARRAAADGRRDQRLLLDRPPLDDAQLAAIDASGDTAEVLRALEQLPEGQRAAIRAIVLEDRSYEESARLLAATQATVRKRVSRGLATLRASVEESS